MSINLPNSELGPYLIDLGMAISKIIMTLDDYATPDLTNELANKLFYDLVDSIPLDDRPTDFKEVAEKLGAYTQNLRSRLNDNDS